MCDLSDQLPEERVIWAVCTGDVAENGGQGLFVRAESRMDPQLAVPGRLEGARVSAAELYCGCDFSELRFQNPRWAHSGHMRTRTNFGGKSRCMP